MQSSEKQDERGGDLGAISRAMNKSINTERCQVCRTVWRDTKLIFTTYGATSFFNDPSIKTLCRNCSLFFGIDWEWDNTHS